MPDLRVNEVGTTGDGARLLVLVHGYGADEYDLAPIAPHIDPAGDFFTICPRGRFDVPGAGAAWYERDAAGAIDPLTFVGSVDALDAVIDKTCAARGLDRSSAVIVGFSQGAAMALATTFRAGGGVQPSAVACLSGSLQQFDGLNYDFSAPTPAVLVQHGTVDPVVPIERGERTCEVLSNHDVDHTWQAYPMAHAITPESIADLRAWLSAV